MPGTTYSAPERNAKYLAWFSLGLGLPQVLVPGRVSRLIGLRDAPGTRKLMRAVGLRELMAAGGLMGRPQPTAWMWARVAGDVKDLTLLGLALRSGDNDRRRVVAATAAVAGVTAVDAATSARLTRRSSAR